MSKRTDAEPFQPSKMLEEVQPEFFQYINPALKQVIFSYTPSFPDVLHVNNITFHDAFMFHTVGDSNVPCQICHDCYSLEYYENCQLDIYNYRFNRRKSALIKYIPKMYLLIKTLPLPRKVVRLYHLLRGRSMKLLKLVLVLSTI